MGHDGEGGGAMGHGGVIHGERRWCHGTGWGDLWEEEVELWGMVQRVVGGGRGIIGHVGVIYEGRRWSYGAECVSYGCGGGIM